MVISALIFSLGTVLDLSIVENKTNYEVTMISGQPMAAPVVIILANQTGVLYEYKSTALACSLTKVSQRLVFVFEKRIK